MNSFLWALIAFIVSRIGMHDAQRIDREGWTLVNTISFSATVVMWVATMVMWARS